MFFALLIASPAFAQTNWNTSGGGDWFTGGNWDNGVPNGGMDACIGSDCDGVGPALLTGTVFIQAPGASVNTVSILDGFTLQVNGAGTLDTTVSAFVPGIIVGTSSTFLVDCGGQATLGGVIMSGSPTMTVDGAGSQIYGHG